MKVYGNLDLRNNGSVRFLESSANQTDFIALRAPASVASSLTFVLPGTDLANGAILSDGSGNLSIAQILNANIGAGAAIAYSKLSLSNSIVNADINASAAILESKLSLDFSTSSLNTAIGTKLSLSGGTMTGAINAGGFAISNLGAPSAASDSATKGYVDAAINGFSWKSPVNAATTANITLSGAQTIDGVSVVATNRVLVKNQTAPAENGIYVAAAGAWSRASDMDSLSPLDEFNGAAVFVLAGTVGANKAFVESATVAVVDTDPVTFVQFSAAGAYIGGNGISISGSTIAVSLASNSGLQFTSNALDLFLNGGTLSKGASGLKVADLGIADGQISASAAIAFSKMAALTASRALASDGSGFVSASAVTSTELGYVSGVTSAIQTQFTGKAALAGDTFTGNVVLDNQKELRLREATGGGTNYVALRAPAALAADNTYDLPTAYPASSGYLLASTTAGAMSWIAPPTVSSFKDTWTNAQGTSKTVTHNLGTVDVMVQIYDSVGAGAELISADTVVATSTNVVTLTSNQAPAVSWRVLVLAV